MIRSKILLYFLFSFSICQGQSLVNTDNFDTKSKVKLVLKDSIVNIAWPVGSSEYAKLVLDLSKENSLFKRVELNNKQVISGLDPVFILTIGKRDLISQNGWNIFFDKVPDKSHQSYNVQFNKKNAAIISYGSRTLIRIGEMGADSFTGSLEITLFNGSPLFNIAAVLSTKIDSTAILYDAGLVSKKNNWDQIAWSNTRNELQYASKDEIDSAKNVEVKYRTIIGENSQGSMAIFPAPHQYFYPLDEAFNLKFTWYGSNYRNRVPIFGMGIRQDLKGDKRFVPWFNAPPQSHQRLNFYCFISDKKAGETLEKVKLFTHNDTYKPLIGYKTLASHFHNEFIMNVVMKDKPIPEHPSFVEVFKNTRVDMVHLAEFHYTAHPKGPDETKCQLSANG